MGAVAKLSAHVRQSSLADGSARFIKDRQHVFRLSASMHIAELHVTAQLVAHRRIDISI
jgi:hypothetical protein